MGLLTRLCFLKASLLILGCGGYNPPSMVEKIAVEAAIIQANGPDIYSVSLCQSSWYQGDFIICSNKILSDSQRQLISAKISKSTVRYSHFRAKPNVMPFTVFVTTLDVINDRSLFAKKHNNLVVARFMKDKNYIFVTDRIFNGETDLEHELCHLFNSVTGVPQHLDEKLAVQFESFVNEGSTGSGL